MIILQILHFNLALNYVQDYNLYEYILTKTYFANKTIMTHEKEELDRMYT